MNRNNLHIERSIRYDIHTFVEELSFFDLRNFNISRYGSLIVNILFVNFIRRLEHPMTLKRHRAQIANRLVYELKSIKIQIFQNERQSVKYSIQSKGQKSSTVSDHFPINREREEDSKRANWYLVSFLRSSYFRPKMVNPTKSQGKLNNMRNITYRSKCSIGAFMCVTCACLTQNISPKLKWTVYQFHLNFVCVYNNGITHIDCFVFKYIGWHEIICYTIKQSDFVSTIFVGCVNRNSNLQIHLIR